MDHSAASFGATQRIDWNKKQIDAGARRHSGDGFLGVNFYRYSGAVGQVALQGADLVCAVHDVVR